MDARGCVEMGIRLRQRSAQHEWRFCKVRRPVSAPWLCQLSMELPWLGSRQENELGAICKNDSTLGHHRYSTFCWQGYARFRSLPSQLIESDSAEKSTSRGIDLEMT